MSRVGCFYPAAFMTFLLHSLRVQHKACPFLLLQSQLLTAVRVSACFCCAGTRSHLRFPSGFFFFVVGWDCSLTSTKIKVFEKLFSCLQLKLSLCQFKKIFPIYN